MAEADPNTPAETSEAAMEATRLLNPFRCCECSEVFFLDDPLHRIALALDAFAARAVEAAVAKERVRCLRWAVGSGRRVVEGIEDGREAP